MKPPEQSEDAAAAVENVESGSVHSFIPEESLASKVVPLGSLESDRQNWSCTMDIYIYIYTIDIDSI